MAPGIVVELICDVSSSGKSKKESFVGIKFAEQKSNADELRCFLNTSESAV
jgi:hypothetical protein